MTPETLALREILVARLDEFQVLLDRYGATNPKLFGSVARGTASAGSDIDILVGMDPAEGRLLMRASGLLEESRALFGRDGIDVFPAQLLRHRYPLRRSPRRCRCESQSGEAVNHLPDEITGAHPEIVWPQIRDLRNILVHQYFGVDIDVVRDVVDTHLPPLA